MSFFYFRPAIRQKMSEFEEEYRMEERVPDDEPLSSIDVFILRRYVMTKVRNNMIALLGPSRYVH